MKKRNTGARPDRSEQRQNSGQFSKGNPHRFQPGESGNPGGRPKNDLAAEIARAAFEKDPLAVIEAMHEALREGNAKVFAALGDRGYGRVPQHISLGGEGQPVEFNLRVEFVSPQAKAKSKEKE